MQKATRKIGLWYGLSLFYLVTFGFSSFWIFWQIVSSNLEQDMAEESDKLFWKSNFYFEKKPNYLFPNVHTKIEWTNQQLLKYQKQNHREICYRCRGQGFFNPVYRLFFEIFYKTLKLWYDFYPVIFYKISVNWIWFALFVI